MTSQWLSFWATLYRQKDINAALSAIDHMRAYLKVCRQEWQRS